MENNNVLYHNQFEAMNAAFAAEADGGLDSEDDRDAGGDNGGDDQSDQEQQDDEQQPRYAQFTCPSGPERMEITEEGRQLALAIKEAVESIPELDNLADFWYAQAAIVDRDNIQSAIDRFHQMQIFRQEYNILDTFDHGRRCLQGYLKLMPGNTLGHTYSEQDDTFVHAFHLNKFDPGNLSTLAEVNIFNGFCYYTCQLGNLDLRAVQRGILLLCECQDFDPLQQGRHFKLYQKIWAELVAVYPTVLQGVKHYHTGVLFNMAASMIKPLLSKDVRPKFQTGCRSDQRLDELYLLPSLEVANKRALHTMEACLERRYHHEKTFSL